MRTTLTLPTLPKRTPRCNHHETTSLVIAGMRCELCVSCRQMTLIPVEWESEFELATGDSEPQARAV